jgi:hypothetical protein
MSHTINNTVQYVPLCFLLGGLGSAKACRAPRPTKRVAQKAKRTTRIDGAFQSWRPDHFNPCALLHAPSGRPARGERRWLLPAALERLLSTMRAKTALPCGRMGQCVAQHYYHTRVV